MDSDEIIKKCEKMTLKYPNDFSESFSKQMLEIKSLLVSKCQQLESTRQMADYIFTQKWLKSSIPDVCTAYQLFLTLPITSAGAERSFSKLKLIKTYLRSTMSQTRLSSLAILSIESERVNQINISDIVDSFISKRKNLKDLVT